MFSDESKVMLYKDYGRHKCIEDWGKDSNKHVSKKKLPTVMCLYLCGSGFLLRVAQNVSVHKKSFFLTSDRYVEEILNEHIGPFMVVVGENAIFMHDNARLNTD